MDDARTIGTYQIRGTLGEGAMGVVHDGWDPRIGRRVAIKTVRLPAEPDPETTEAIARFRREAQAAGSLGHPNIVTVYDYGETSDIAFIVMEYVDGPTLKTLLDRSERFALSDIVDIMEQLLAGLQFSHARGVVHRDIKPANVMLTSEKRVKIADFGIARIEQSSMTQVGTLMGTPAYMSPEQFMGQTVDARTDVYSSGVLLYQLLTGERPFEGGGLSTIMQKALNTEPLPPSQLSVVSPPAMDAVVAKAMAKRPSDRYATADAFAKAIRAAATQTTAAMPPPVADDSDATVVSHAGKRPAATVTPPPTPARRGGGGMLVAGAAVVVIVLLAAGGWFLLGDKTAPPPTKTAEATGGTSASSDTPPSAAPPRQQTPPPTTTAEATPPAPPPARTEAPPPPPPPPPPPTTAAEAAAPTPAVTPPAEPPPPEPKVATTTPPPPPAPVTRAPVAEPPVAQPPVAQTPVVQPPVVQTPVTQPPVAAATPEPPPAPEKQAMVVPPPPPPPAEPARPSAAALRAQVAEVLRQTHCAWAAASVPEEGPIEVSGLAIDPRALAQAVGGATGGARAVASSGLTPVISPNFCRALDLLRGIAADGPDGLAIGMPGPGGATLREDDYIRPRITMPDFAGSLRVDDLFSDGTLQHLYPPVTGAPKTLPAKAELALGDKGKDSPTWQVGAPFGTDMILAFASSQPLDVAPKSDVEDSIDAAAGYLGQLTRAIDAARRAGAQVTGTALPIHTLPKQ
jgi:serine/threonine protein kinase